MGTLALILIPAAVFLGVVWAVLAVGGGARVDGERLRWGPPATRIALVAVFVVIGLLVAPRLLGFTFLFLPFVLGRRAGRRRGRRTGDDDPRW